MLRVYLDNDVASAISRRQTAMAAVDHLLNLKQLGTIVLDTSRQSTREMERAPAQYQQSLKAGLQDLGVAPDDHKALGSYTLTDRLGGCICNPLVSDVVDEGYSGPQKLDSRVS